MSVTIDLSQYAVRQQVQTKQVILDRLLEKGIVLENPRIGLSALLELEPILLSAKNDGLKLTIPPVPRRFVRGRRFGGGDWINAYERYDANNLAMMAFADYGMTAGLVSSMSARTITQLLRSFN